MNKKTYSISKTMISVKNLKQAAMLKKYGIDKPSEFEIAQLKRFGLTDHLNGVVATADGIVLCNWELVLIAKNAGIKEIEIINIDNLTEDEILQVIAVKNIRKKLSKHNLASLIIEYRDYLTKNEAGRTWAEEIPGDSTDAKIGELLGYSYGMINGYQTINKYHPEFLKMMDDGDMTYTQALQAVKDEKACEPPIPGNGVTPTAPVKVQAPKHSYAGERIMVPCTPMEAMTIRYADGRTIEIEVKDKNAFSEFFGIPVIADYSSKREGFDCGAEFHRIDSADNRYSIELVIRAAA